MEANHNRRFHELLAGFPNAERAEGFLNGYQWAVSGGVDSPERQPDDPLAQSS